MRWLIILLLLVPTALALDFYGCNETISIASSSELNTSTELKCYFERERIDLGFAGWFFPDDDISARFTGEDKEMVFTTENRIIDEIRPKRSRVTVDIVCSRGYIDYLIDAEENPLGFQVLHNSLSDCSFHARRFTAVPQVALFKTSLSTLQSFFWLLNGGEGSLWDVSNSLLHAGRIMFAPHFLAVETVSEFVGVLL